MNDRPIIGKPFHHSLVDLNIGTEQDLSKPNPNQLICSTNSKSNLNQQLKPKT